MTAPLRKAVFPVAGLGTRFLPATKAMPKEMLTLVDRPLIQYVVDEARAAGIEQFIFVTATNKSVLEDHFDSLFELEATLKAARQDRGPGRARQPHAAAGRGKLHPPAEAARPRPCGVVRPPSGRRRALRGGASRHDHAGRTRLPGANDGGLQRDRRQCHRSQRVRPRGDRQLRHRRRRRAGRFGWRRLSPDRHGGEAVSRRTRRPISISAAATSCSRRFSTCSPVTSAAPATRSSLPTRC